MRLGLTDEQEAFRQGCDSFVREHWNGGDDAAAIAFRGNAIAAGYSYHWLPRRYGGVERPRDLVLEWLWIEACRKFGAPARPAGTAVQMLVPVLLESGSDEQCRRFLLPALTGEEIWGQGFSEPGAGSDLASLRTKAAIEDGHWVVDGQKIWTTHAERASFMFALVRTEPEAPRHRGISFLLIDMRQAGVTVHPIRQMTGEHEYCEVFFDRAHTPVENIIGGRGGGWTIANQLLKHERSWIGDFVEERFARLSDLVRAAAFPYREDLLVRLATIEGKVLCHKASALRRLSGAAEGSPTALIDLVAKLYATDVMQAISHLAADAIGDRILGPSDDPWGTGVSTPDGYWVRDWYWSIAYAVAGGTSNIQRDVIALRGLGLARAA